MWTYRPASFVGGVYKGETYNNEAGKSLAYIKLPVVLATTLTGQKLMLNGRFAG